MAQRFLMFLALLAASCGEPGGEITDVREVRAPDRPIPWGVTSAQRFGFESRRPSQASPHGQGGPSFQYDLPKGWSEQPKTNLRLLNFRVAGNEAAECYLTVLPGAAGGTLANVNRWRGQMSLGPIDDDAIKALPRKDLLGGSASYVDLTGTYKGMGSDGKAEFRMVGLILDLGQRALFLKMVGPKNVIDKEVEPCLALAASIRTGGASAQPQPENPHGGNQPKAEFSWEAPEGWVQGPPRSMRLVTFAPGGSEQATCYVSILGGRAGGVAANLNRWREQMGQKALTKAELKDLPRLIVLGVPSPMVEIGGELDDKEAGAKQNAAGMLALVCELEGRTLFVKMTGPKALVQKEKDHFIAFCTSLTRRHP